MENTRNHHARAGFLHKCCHLSCIKAFKDPDVMYNNVLETKSYRYEIGRAIKLPKIKERSAIRRSDRLLVIRNCMMNEIIFIKL